MENHGVSCEENDLDPRIQIELETLNTATDEINKLEIELDEATTTFRMLLNESTRRLKLSGSKFGSCIEKARPYYRAVDEAKGAQRECQKAAVEYQRANEFLTAAKEMVALAERRFENGEFNFDGAWQEMLNHANSKVIQAEIERAKFAREHQAKAQLFQIAEQKVQQLEDNLRRHILKSRPYFDEKDLCQEQLNTQKNRIESLQLQLTHTKNTYSESLKKLELISEEIHQKRKRNQSESENLPQGPRLPGVGAEINTYTQSETKNEVMFDQNLKKCENANKIDQKRPIEGCSTEKDSNSTQNNLILTETNENLSSDQNFEVNCYDFNQKRSIEGCSSKNDSLDVNLTQKTPNSNEILSETNKNLSSDKNFEVKFEKSRSDSNFKRSIEGCSTENEFLTQKIADSNEILSETNKNLSSDKNFEVKFEKSRSDSNFKRSIEGCSTENEFLTPKITDSNEILSETNKNLSSDKNFEVRFEKNCPDSNFKRSIEGCSTENEYIGQKVADSNENVSEMAKNLSLDQNFEVMVTKNSYDIDEKCSIDSFSSKNDTLEVNSTQKVSKNANFDSEMSPNDEKSSNFVRLNENLSENDQTEDDFCEANEELLILRSIEGCSDNNWSSEMKTTVEKLDHMNLMNECVQIEKKQEQSKKKCDRNV